MLCSSSNAVPRHSCRTSSIRSILTLPCQGHLALTWPMPGNLRRGQLHPQVLGWQFEVRAVFEADLEYTDRCGAGSVRWDWGSSYCFPRNRILGLGGGKTSKSSNCPRFQRPLRSMFAKITGDTEVRQPHAQSLHTRDMLCAMSRPTSAISQLPGRPRLAHSRRHPAVGRPIDSASVCRGHLQVSHSGWPVSCWRGG